MVYGVSANALNLLLLLGGIADIAGLAAGSTRSQMTQSGHGPKADGWTPHPKIKPFDATHAFHVSAFPHATARWTASSGSLLPAMPSNSWTMISVLRPLMDTRPRARATMRSDT